MAPYQYSFKDNENSAKAVGLSLPISGKHSKQICKYLQGRKLELAKRILEGVMKKEQAIPFKNYDDGAGHKKGMAAGRYPIKASENILKTIQSAEANAQFKGLNTANLIIKHIISKKAPTTIRAGRNGGKRAKRTHIEIMLTQQK